jgi:DNA adenine methylase
MTDSKQKPIIKWVGGKTQIIDKILDNFPEEINNYHEPCIGGASVLLALLQSDKIKINGNIYAYDINEALIYVYKNIQDNHEELYVDLQNIINDFNECDDDNINRKPKTKDEAMTSKESYYYWIRSEYNKIINKREILASAMFIFLNKTCFRGVYREGPNGFNVPYGHYNNPEIINKNHLDEFHILIQNVIFECCDFVTSISNVNTNDFIYIDPPYAPETLTSFVGYTKKGFNVEQHNNLFNLLNSLENIKFMMSNSDTTLVKEKFNNLKYNITTIVCKRSINSKKPNAKTNELIIKNY